MTGYDISGWKGTGKSKEEQKSMQWKKVVFQQCFLRVGNKTAVLDATSMFEQVEEAAGVLWEAMVGALTSQTRRMRWGSRSKLYWMEDLTELQKDLGRERWQPAGIGRIQNVRRNLWWANWKVKKEYGCWNIWIDKHEDCLTWFCGHKISEYRGRLPGQRTEDCPSSRCLGTQVLHPARWWHPKTCN